ncbi:MAG: glutamate ligase domain-containing protein, partial [Deinococcus sp.]
LEEIAGEKAGILRPGRPAVTGVEPGLWPILDRVGADLWRLGREAGLEARSLGWDGWTVELAFPGGSLAFQTPLLGEHGARNAALAGLAAQRLGVGEEAIRRGSLETRWPGWLERLSWRGRDLLLDGAHNPDGARALRRTLAGLGLPPLPFVFGAAQDKDLAGLVRELSPAMSEVILTRARLSPRAAPPGELAPLFRGTGLRVRLSDSPAGALALLPPGPGVVCGSLYLIGEVRPLLTGEAAEGRERWQ